MTSDIYFMGLGSEPTRFLPEDGIPPEDAIEVEPMRSDWPYGRAADMLAAYAELVKATGRYAEEHYIPEIEDVIRELRSLAAPTPAPEGEAQAWVDVRAERQRQISAEGWTPEHDDEHDHQDMALAAAAYALCYARPQPEWVRLDGTRVPPQFWPWDIADWKPKGPRRDLVKAGALILAEIERIDRATHKAEKGENQ